MADSVNVATITAGNARYQSKIVACETSLDTRGDHRGALLEVGDGVNDMADTWCLGCGK